MSRLCINLEILAAAARVQLRLSGRNEMPDNCQNEMGSWKPMNLHRKINIFGMELSTEGAVTEKPFAEVSFFPQ